MFDDFNARRDTRRDKQNDVGSEQSPSKSNQYEDLDATCAKESGGFTQAKRAGKVMEVRVQVWLNETGELQFRSGCVGTANDTMILSMVGLLQKMSDSIIRRTDE
jgi:hypothetical protein